MVFLAVCGFFCVTIILGLLLPRASFAGLAVYLAYAHNLIVLDISWAIAIILIGLFICIVVPARQLVSGLCCLALFLGMVRIPHENIEAGTSDNKRQKIEQVPPMFRRGYHYVMGHFVYLVFFGFGYLVAFSGLAFAIFWKHDDTLLDVAISVACFVIGFEICLAALNRLDP